MKKSNFHFNTDRLFCSSMYSCNTCSLLTTWFLYQNMINSWFLQYCFGLVYQCPIPRKFRPNNFSLTTDLHCNFNPDFKTVICIFYCPPPVYADLKRFFGLGLTQRFQDSVCCHQGLGILEALEDTYRCHILCK